MVRMHLYLAQQRAGSSEDSSSKRATSNTVWERALWSGGRAPEGTRAEEVDKPERRVTGAQAISE